MEESSPPLGRLLGDSFRLTRDGWRECSAIVAAGILPGFLLKMIVGSATGVKDQEDMSMAIVRGDFMPVLSNVAAGMIGELFALFALVALVLSLQARAAGQSPGIGKCFRRALGQVLPFLLTGLRLLFYILAGLVLFVIPGVLILMRCCLAPLAVLLEDKTGSAALARSRELVSPHWPKVAGNLLAGASIAALAAAALSLLFKTIALGLPGNLLRQWSGGMIAAWLISFSMLLYKDLAALHPSPGI